MFNWSAGQNAILDLLYFCVTLLAHEVLRPYNKSVGQQHRVRTKRTRRKAYLKRKKKTLRSKRRESSKPRAKKEPTAAE
jgi:hypothetical protein